MRPSGRHPAFLPTPNTDSKTRHHAAGTTTIIAVSFPLSELATDFLLALQPLLFAKANNNNDTYNPKSEQQASKPPPRLLVQPKTIREIVCWDFDPYEKHTPTANILTLRLFSLFQEKTPAYEKPASNQRSIDLASPSSGNRKAGPPGFGAGQHIDPTTGTGVYALDKKVGSAKAWADRFSKRVPTTWKCSSKCKPKQKPCLTWKHIIIILPHPKAQYYPLGGSSIRPTTNKNARFSYYHGS